MGDKSITASLVIMVTVMLLLVSGFMRHAEGSGGNRPVFTARPGFLFNHFVVSDATGTKFIYVGGVSRIYQLNEDLTLLREESTDPEEPGGNLNENKILTIAPSPLDRLVLCRGSDSTCELRFLENISLDQQFSTNEQYRVTDSLPAVGVVDKDYDDQLYFYVAASLNGSNTDFIPPLSKRQLPPSYFVFNYQERSEHITIGFSVKFTHAFKWNDHIYFILNSFHNNDTRGPAKIGRLCPSSRGSSLEHYTQVPITCGAMNSLTAAHIGLAGTRLAADLNISDTDGVLYAVFSDDTFSLLCVFTMKSIQDKITDAIYGCSSNSAEPSLARPIEYLESGLCQQQYPITRDLAYELTKKCSSTAYGILVYKYAEADEQLTGVIVQDGLPDDYPAIAITILDKESLAFLVSSTGNLTKVHIHSSNESTILETIDIGISGTVLTDVHMDDAVSTLYVLTSQELVKVPLINCKQYTIIDVCVKPSPDPLRALCGWCTFESRCTVQSDCPYSTEEHRWEKNAERGISITHFCSTEIDVLEIPLQITFILNNLPELHEGEDMFCHFGDVMTGTVQMDGPLALCMTPGQNELPSFEEEHMITTLIVTNQAGGILDEKNITFYNCSALNSRSQCVRGRWSCDWCDTSFTCISEAANCSLASPISHQHSGYIAATTILAVLLIISLVVNVLQFLRKRDHTEQGGKPPTDSVTVAYRRDAEHVYENSNKALEHEAKYEDPGHISESSYQELFHPARPVDDQTYEVTDAY